MVCGTHFSVIKTHLLVISMLPVKADFSHLSCFPVLTSHPWMAGASLVLFENLQVQGLSQTTCVI